MCLPAIAILFNGEPGIGKDYTARALRQQLSGPTRILRFKSALFDDLAARVKTATFSEFDRAWLDSRYYDLYKDDRRHQLVLVDDFIGTVRECLIHVSEEIIKPTLGDDHYGVVLAGKLQAGWNLISDGGFPSEVSTLRPYADVLVVVQLKGSWGSGAKDSRGVLKPDIVVDMIEGDIRHTCREILKRLPDFVSYEQRAILAVYESIVGSDY